MKLASRNLPRTWVGISGMVLSMLAAPVQVHPEAQFRAANDPNVAWLGSHRENVTEFAKLVNGQMRFNPLALHSARIHLQYPDGQNVTAVRDRLETHAIDNFAWVGHVEGQPLSRVCLGSSGGTMAGFIDRTAYTPGDRWHLLPNGSGAYSFSKNSGAEFTCSASSTLPKGQRKALQAGLSIAHSPSATTLHQHPCPTHHHRLASGLFSGVTGPLWAKRTWSHD